MFTIFTLFFGLVATIPHFLGGMEQPSTKNPFIDPYRGAQARALEKLNTTTLGWHTFVLTMLKTKAPFASTSTSLENKLNLAVEAFISAKSTPDLFEFLNLCMLYNLPIQNGALERARKFIDEGITAQCETLRSQFNESLATVNKHQAMLQKIEGLLKKNQSTPPIEKPIELFALLYNDKDPNPPG